MSGFTEANRWTELVWGDRRGFFCFVFGVGGHIDENGKYVFKRGGWQERFGRWPDDYERFFDEAFERAAQDDVYVDPVLRSTPSRKKGNALPSNVGYADVDKLVHGRNGLESLLGGPGGLIVNSGQEGHRHVYVPLRDELEPAELERLNRHLAHFLHADASWAENKVLRLPGTLNHKGRARGGDSLPVTIVEDRRAVRDWTPDELVELFGPSPEANDRAETVAVAPVMPESVPEHLLARLDEKPGEHPGQQTYGFVGACVKAGLDDAAVTALGLQYRPAVEKLGAGSKRLHEDIARTLGKHRAGATSPRPRPEVAPTGDADGTFRLEPVDWQALAAEGPPKLGYLSAPFLPKRKRIWAVGAGESGKSIWGAAKSAELSRAKELVVYVSQENGIEEEARRFLRLRPGFEHLRLYVDQGLDLMYPDHREALFAAAEGAALVVLDTFTACWSGDEDSNDELTRFDRDVMKPLQVAGTSVLVLDHTGNPQPNVRRRGVSAPRGASSKGQKTDFLLEFRATGDGSFRVERGKKRGTSGREPRDYRVVDAEDGTLELVETEAEERDLVGEIAELLEDGEWRTANWLRQPKSKGGVGADLNAVKDALDDDRFESAAGPTIGKRKGSTWYRLKEAS